MINDMTTYNYRVKYIISGYLYNFTVICNFNRQKLNCFDVLLFHNMIVICGHVIDIFAYPYIMTTFLGLTALYDSISIGRGGVPPYRGFSRRP